MSNGDVSAKQGSSAVGGDNSGSIVNINAPNALSVSVAAEQRIDQQLPSFLGELILLFSEQGLSEYGKGDRRALSGEVLAKIKHNHLPTNHRVICDFLRYSHVLEESYLGVEQRNADARYLVRRKAGVAYEAEIPLYDTAVSPPAARLDFVRLNATTIVTNVINRLIQDYKSSREVKVHQEIAHLAISLIVADAIVECEVLERA